MNGVLVDGGARTEPVRLSDRTRNYLIGGVVAAGIAILIALQVFASSRGFEGPLTSLLNDFVGTPKSASVPWAGLALAMVGLTNRQRVLALSSALVIDVVVAGIRYLAGDRSPSATAR